MHTSHSLTETAGRRHAGQFIALLIFSLLMIFVLQLVTQRAYAAEPAATTQADSKPVPRFEDLLPQLITDDFQKKEAVLEQLTRTDHPQLLKTFRYLLNGELYYRKADKRIVHLETSDKGNVAYDILTGKNLGVVGHFDVRRIGIDNNMRSMLGVEIAKLSLSSKDPKVRLKAVEEMITSLDPDSIKLLKARDKIEKNARVKNHIDVALALGNLGHGDNQQRLEAIDFLGGSLLPEVRIALKQLLFKDDKGNYLEKDSAIRHEAQLSLRRIDDKVEMYNVLQTTFFGLSLGSVLLLSAIGLAITFGVMGVINMAHGEMMMLGAYTTYLVQQMFPGMMDYSLLISIPAAFVVSGLFGIAIERSVIRWLYGRPLETLLATFGISLILQQLVRTTISAQNVSVSTPGWMSGSWQINPVFALTYNRLYIVIFSLVVFIALL
ncbi:MAG: urea ABC transporter permease subunit UrtB, partial [Gammaproteobacteria bacterium]